MKVVASSTADEVGYRFLDRQWISADRRLMHRPSPDLWAARIPNQIFVVERHSKPITNGPGVVFSSLIPGMHHFRGSQGGRTLPELLDLLRALTRLIELHHDQAQLLDKILDEPLASVADLAAVGVTWPQGLTDAQRRRDCTATVTADDSSRGELPTSR